MIAPRDLADAQARLDATETALAGLVHENNELRAIVRRVRDHASWQRQMADELCAIGKVYQAIPYRDTALAIERIIGDRP